MEAEAIDEIAAFTFLVNVIFVSLIFLLDGGRFWKSDLPTV